MLFDDSVPHPRVLHGLTQHLGADGPYRSPSVGEGETHDEILAQSDVVPVHKTVEAHVFLEYQIH